MKKKVSELDSKITTLFNKMHEDEKELIPNATRFFDVGQSVIIGNLKNCIVEKNLKDGRFVAFSHDVITRRGDPVQSPKKRDVMIFPWIEVLPDVEQVNRFGSRQPIHNIMSSDISGLMHSIYFRGIFDNPDYQRDYVWDESDKVNLIESIFNYNDIGKFIFVSHPFPENRFEVLDGKQRVSAISEFIEGRFQYKGVFYHDLSREDRRAFKSLRIQTLELDSELITKKDILKLFLSVNCGGVPQSKEHLLKVQEMYDNIDDDEFKMSHP